MVLVPDDSRDRAEEEGNGKTHFFYNRMETGSKRRSCAYLAVRLEESGF